MMGKFVTNKKKGSRKREFPDKVHARRKGFKLNCCGILPVRTFFLFSDPFSSSNLLSFILKQWWNTMKCACRSGRRNMGNYAFLNFTSLLYDMAKMLMAECRWIGPWKPPVSHRYDCEWNLEQNNQKKNSILSRSLVSVYVYYLLLMGITRLLLSRYGSRVDRADYVLSNYLTRGIYAPAVQLYPLALEHTWRMWFGGCSISSRCDIETLFESG